MTTLTLTIDGDSVEFSVPVPKTVDDGGGETVFVPALLTSFVFNDAVESFGGEVFVLELTEPT